MASQPYVGHSNNVHVEEPMRYSQQMWCILQHRVLVPSAGHWWRWCAVPVWACLLLWGDSPATTGTQHWLSLCGEHCLSDPRYDQPQGNRWDFNVNMSTHRTSLRGGWWFLQWLHSYTNNTHNVLTLMTSSLFCLISTCILLHFSSK